MWMLLFPVVTWSPAKDPKAVLLLPVVLVERARNPVGRKGEVAGMARSSGGGGYAARRTYRWCRPPTSRIGTTFPSSGGSTGLP